MKARFFAAVPLAVFLACAAPSLSPTGGGGATGAESMRTDGGGSVFGNSMDGGPIAEDPATCEEAKAARSYVGCDYWPTVMPNAVQDAFDFAIAVANVGKADADIMVTGPGGFAQRVTIAPGSLERVFLPWVDGLKNITGSALVRSGAYHVVSSRPVVVYQFSPLEFKAQGGPPGKSWSTCQKAEGVDECYSYSNDASLLLPSTAMTGNYRVMGSSGFSFHPHDHTTQQPDLTQPLVDAFPAYFVVTATQDGTNVTVKLGAKATVSTGNGLPQTITNQSFSLGLDAGDVAVVSALVGSSFDMSGSLVTADKPIQTIAGVACVEMPFDENACDHVEETLFPAETLGKHYVVARPTGPKANIVSQVVRLYGNVDGTRLTYKPAMPPGCPSTLDAGAVVECGTVVTTDFEVSGDHEFGIATFLLGGQLADPDFDLHNVKVSQGDPSQSFSVSTEQYRKHYVFLAPSDYKSSYADVVAAPGTKLTLDGQDVGQAFTQIAGTDWLLARLPLTTGKDGAHTLDASAPVGIQVMGYGDYTSYQYPGGLNLGQIAPAPVK